MRKDSAIGLLTWLGHLWSRMRSRPAEAWASARSGPWDAAVRGNSALREALLRCRADEAALASALPE
eukprot:9045167-Pyramimonas_sp.AAC.1